MPELSAVCLTPCLADSMTWAASLVRRLSPEHELPRAPCVEVLPCMRHGMTQPIVVVTAMTRRLAWVAVPPEAHAAFPAHPRQCHLRTTEVTSQLLQIAHPPTATAVRQAPSVWLLTLIVRRSRRSHCFAAARCAQKTTGHRVLQSAGPRSPVATACSPGRRQLLL